MNETNNNALTVEKLINSRRQFAPELLEIVKEFARSKPWRGTQAERLVKFATLHAKLCEKYQIECKLEFRSQGEFDTPTGACGYNPREKRIVLIGRLSVVTYLHLFTRARGAGRREAFAWSLNLFARVFPRSFSAAKKSGPLLFKNS